MSDGNVTCYDCGRPYGDEHGFPDLLLPEDVWRQISPTGDEGGLLCPSCICKRLHDAGIRTGARFTSGPLAVKQVVYTGWALPEDLSDPFDHVYVAADRRSPREVQVLVRILGGPRRALTETVCPGCDSAEHLRIRSLPPEAPGYRVGCTACGILGPAEFERTHAVEAWDRVLGPVLHALGGADR